jgi:hypothetical protein
MGIAGGAGRVAAVALVVAGTLPGAAAAEGGTPAGGASQSPIDIRQEEVTFVDELPRIRFRYPDAKVEVINTGSPDREATIRAVVNTPASIRVSGKRYRLSQFHFHTPSEHLLDGEAFPMELHLVHQANDGELLVLGVFIELGDRHKELKQILRHSLPTPARPGRPGASNSTRSSPAIAGRTVTRDPSRPRRSPRAFGGSCSTSRWNSRNVRSPRSRSCSRTGTPGSPSHSTIGRS